MQPGWPAICAIHNAQWIKNHWNVAASEADPATMPSKKKGSADEKKAGCRCLCVLMLLMLEAPVVAWCKFCSCCNVRLLWNGANWIGSNWNSSDWLKKLGAGN
ncbi:uncharacterized protein LOC118746291 isoform X1 [Rhagoletis pomonella]|uniref:uncharacterized protein LOC118746291 isoform X1 n=1 Tax=Rhagoletis pomonella TaxID=28610 RepID=UPI00177ACE60|nr:uncharacterized protein LOC118746291 isoform X1 [Rhagoletis pomonella]